ncbi:glutathione S-transferase C-terminal domain-containing protein, partial [Elysia marginata]
DLQQANSFHTKTEATLTLPLDLLKLETHFVKKCRVHNDDKKKRAELQRLKKLLIKPSDANLITLKNEEKHEVKAAHITTTGERQVATVQNKSLLQENHCSVESEACVEKIDVSNSKFEVEYQVKLPHGVRKVRVEKSINASMTSKELGISELEYAFSALSVTSENCEKLDSEAFLAKAMSLPGLAKVVEHLTYLDIEYVHTYSEGAEMTLADLILFVFLYYFLEQLNFDCSSVAELLPNILQWMEHIASLPFVFQTGQVMGWHMMGMAEGLRMLPGQNKVASTTVSFKQPKEPACGDEDEMELR